MNVLSDKGCINKAVKKCSEEKKWAWRLLI